MKRPFEFIGRIRSFKYALKGVFTMLASQHNAWIHAGAVLIAALGAVIIGVLVFGPYLLEMMKN